MTQPAQWLRPEVLQGSAYHVADSRGMIKLDAMENPYDLPAGLRSAWAANLSGAALNRYPDPQARKLQLLLRQSLALDADTGLLLGNGSDELIQLLCMAVASPGRSILAPTPTFVMYKLLAECLGLRFIGVPLAANFALDGAAMLAAIAQHQPAIVWLAYPNNPTGNLFDAAAIYAILRAAPGLVVLDEAYSAFSDGHSFLGEIGRYPNLLVMRTLSKQGFAGLRLGLLAGPQNWIAELDKLRLPYNINVLTQLSVHFLLQNANVFAQQAQQILSERQRLFTALGQLPGIQPYPSQANFILLRTAAGRASAIHAALKTRGILIKNLDQAPGLKDCLRVTVGTAEENDAFLQAMESLI